MTDHRLGFPDINKQALQDDADEASGYDVLYLEARYPLGLPKRVKEEDRERYAAFFGRTEAEVEVENFENGDHKENGDIAPGVSDDCVLRGIAGNMNALDTVAALDTFYVRLVDRLRPLRTAELLKMVGAMRDAREQTIREAEKRAECRAQKTEVARAVEAARVSSGLSGFITSAPPGLAPFLARHEHREYSLGFTTSDAQAPLWPTHASEKKLGE